MYDSFSLAENSVGFILDGSFNEETMNRLHQAIENKLKKFEKIKLYIEDDDIETFSVEAIAKNILFKFKNSDRFSKVAFVTNRKWIKACATIENLFLTGEVKVFTSDDRLEAINWITR
mgnify:CR=1 FL=1|tara:strand:+ start:13264 stop:13617 length:354 start_codon:yes stop_codon:yes gene_type:complete